jgi:hypothetical protein
MSDESNGNQSAGAPAEAKNTDMPPAEHMIPKSRFDQINDELRLAKAKIVDFETAQMTEAQKLQAQAQAAQAAAEAARAELRQAKAQAEIARAAQRLGLDIELAERFATPTWDGDTLTGIDASLKAALEKWPHLKPAPQAPVVPPTNPGRQGKALTMEDVKNMSPDEINRRWDEVQGVLAGG